MFSAKGDMAVASTSARMGGAIDCSRIGEHIMGFIAAHQSEGFYTPLPKCYIRVSQVPDTAPKGDDDAFEITRIAAR